MMAVALLPLIGGWVFFARSSETVRIQQENIVEQSLQLTLQKLDADISELSALGARIRPQMRRVNIPAPDQIDIDDRLAFWDASTKLQDFLAIAPDYVDDIYIARSGVSYAVTSSAVVDYDILAKKSWNKGLMVSDLHALHEHDFSGNLVSAAQNRLAFLTSLSQGSSSDLSGRTLVLVIDPAYWQGIARNYGLPGAKYELCAADGSVMLSQEHNVDQSVVIERPFGGGNYILRAYVPQAYFLDTSSSLSFLYYGLLGATLLLGAVLIWLLSRRTAMPINQLIEYIQRNYRSESDDDVAGLNLVFHAVEKMLDDHEAHLKEIERYQAEAEMHDLTDAFLGRAHKERNLPYVVCCAPIAENTDREGIQAAVHASQPEGFACSIAFVEQDMILLLEQESGEMDEEGAERAIEQILQRLDDTGYPGLRCAMSLVHGFGEIETAFREATMAADCMDRQSEPPVLRFDAIRYMPEYFLRDYHHLDKQLAFANLVNEENYDEAPAALVSLFPEEFLRSPKSTLAQLHLNSLKYQFLHDIEVLLKQSDTPDETELNRTLAREIISCKNHPSLLDAMQRILAEWDVHPSKQREDQDMQVQKIKSYIRQNASDQQLSVTSVADAFGMPINRLSKLFSSMTGSGVLQYIHKIRIENACSLLLGEEKLTIGEIAQRVGYTSTLTFSRAFKARYKMTPGEYRKAHAKS